MVKLKYNYKPKYRRYKEEKDLFRNKIEVLYSDAQIDLLKEILQGGNMSRYIRETSLKGAYIEKNKPSRTDRETVLQLKRIGTNLNQIATTFNTYKQNTDFEMIF